MLLLVQYTLIFASVLILVALGGCISERSGVINLGLEGIMVIGAMGGALTMRYLVAAFYLLAAVLQYVGIKFVFTLDKNTLEIMNKELEERRIAAK